MQFSNNNQQQQQQQQYQNYLQTLNEAGQGPHAHTIPPVPTKSAPQPPQQISAMNECNYKYLIGQNMGFQT